MIEAYTFGVFTIDGKVYESNIYLLNKKVDKAPYDHILAAGRLAFAECADLY